ncbi:methionine ABC transporter ATP-binding protein [Pseudolactococcus plantarum]|uniref:Methionine ABC transporter ATP-binding protein n=1 Tax=Pseudolactococcus plantarum TaxID=1365 RepID=A0A2A5S3K9_9LACT|nr:methionine ABC transporter ATP-binding protein [Lactococcus plantarum]PCS08028.1 methionine ABC transporter ATP-binding protein [Lactococcus plantarum]HCN74517.1 methionine ABC transporter ATP-binding protein [Lactococcus sp.]
MINLKDISVTFTQKKSDVTAVDHVSLQIDKGDIYGIVGYSGAGKSTLVRVINLLQKPTQGQVIVEGKDMVTLSARALREERKKIGMIFQHFNLMTSRTIADNVAFPLKGSGLSKADITAKVEKLLALVGILDKKAAYPGQLSGGQKQRVAIARALANDPKILLCDEATSALDPKTTLSILELLQEVNQKLGITIVIITHEMQVVKEICNKVAVMENGRVIEHGDVISIFDQPKAPLTQDFIRTATHVEQAEKKLLAHTDKPLYVLKFPNATGAVIIDLFKKFAVTADILYGNIEFLQEVPIGTLIVTLESDNGGVLDLDAISDYLAQRQVRISEIERTTEKEVIA